MNRWEDDHPVWFLFIKIIVDLLFTILLVGVITGTIAYCWRLFS